MLGKSLPPFRDAGWPRLQLPSKLQIGHTLIQQQNHLRAFDQSMFARARPCPLPKSLLLIGAQRNLGLLAQGQLP